MRKLLLLLLVTGSVTASDFMRSVKLVVDSLPAIQQSQLDQQIASEEKKSAISVALPQISASLNQRLGYEAFNVPEEELYKPTTAAVTLQQDLFNLRSYREIALKKAVVKYNDLLYAQQVNRVVKEFSYDWAYWWRNHNRESIVNEMVAITGEDLSNTQYRFKVGELTRVDVTKIASKHYGYQNNFSTAKKESAVSRSKLKEYYQIELPSLVDLPELRIDSSLDLVLQTNPEYQLALVSEKIAQKEKKKEASDWVPRLTGTASAKRVWNTDNSSLPDDYNDFGGSLNLTWDLFRGGDNFASYRRAELEESRSALTKEQIRREVLHRASAAWENVVAARSQVAISAKRLEAAKEGLDGTQSEYLSGTRTTTDLISAQEEYLSARLESVDITMALFLAQIVYLETMGILVPEMIENLTVLEQTHGTN